MKWAAILIALSAVSTQALESRDFDGKVTCGGGLPADYKAVKGGIDYLNGVGGTPVEDPNKCGRVSCSYNSAIYMCNWTNEKQALKSFATLASGAQAILDKCTNDLGVVGKVEAPNGWGVEVAYASC
ncbi:hypothetical protein BDV39DRAFT_199883 [Aspergillus sergii]|uniref:Secreted protein n=1 Tax=Aspergillus sergii TaxID=1034303 RepID=A0A5N6XI16_9EURO|nr:hypothetical protein BDV39DRAFT_199883 [Aspergillus sergii]